jgi:hypothetical protein
MSYDIKESDWKIFRELRELALDRFCKRVLDEINRAASDPKKTAHQRYLVIYKLIHKRDDELAFAFNSPRRSVALEQIAAMHSRGLFAADEFARFSPELRERVETLLRIMEG